jgi:hypothetical protein
MEPRTLACLTCGRSLSYDISQAGDPYECPGCGTRGTLPLLDLVPLEKADEELLLDYADDEPVPAPAPTPVVPIDLVPLKEEEELLLDYADDEPAPAPGALPDHVPLVGGLEPPPIAHPVQEELLNEEIARRVRRSKQAKPWRAVRRGLTVLLVSWLLVAVLATLLLVVTGYHLLQFLLQMDNTAPSLPFAGVLGILLVLAESVALYGYRLCLEVPPEEHLRDLVRVCLGLAAVRNVACLTTSIAFFVVDPNNVRTVGIFTILGAGLFFGHWFVWLLLQRGLAYARREQWLMRMAQRIMALLAFTLLAWIIIWIVFFSAGGSKESIEKQGMIEAAWVTVTFSCGGTLLTAALWLAILWQLKLLNYLRGVLAV